MIETAAFRFDHGADAAQRDGANYRSFEQNVCRWRASGNIHVLGMKAFAEGRLIGPQGRPPTTRCGTRCRCPRPVHGSPGIDSQHVLDPPRPHRRRLHPARQVSLQALRDQYGNRAGDGHLELYKSTPKERTPTKAAPQHGFHR